MVAILPMDARGNVIPCLALRVGGAHKIEFDSEAAVKNSRSFDNKTQVISLYLTQPAYVEFGKKDVIATTESHYFPAGIYYNFSLGGARAEYLAAEAERNYRTYLSVLAVDTSGIAYVSEFE